MTLRTFDSSEIYTKHSSRYQRNKEINRTERIQQAKTFMTEDVNSLSYDIKSLSVPVYGPAQ